MFPLFSVVLWMNSMNENVKCPDGTFHVYVHCLICVVFMWDHTLFVEIFKVKRIDKISENI